VLASGRFTLRLIADGALSFAFVPLCELAAFAVVYRLQRGTKQAMGPASTSALRATADTEAGHFGQAVTWVIPIALSVWLDWQFFRRAGRTRAHTVADIVLQRAIAWTLASACFFGIASSSRDFFYLFVEMKDMVDT